MPRGGKRTGAGRPAGSGNKATATEKQRVSEWAKQYVHAAFEALNNVMQNGSSEAARVSAAVVILDRAFGRPRQEKEKSNNADDIDLMSEALRQISKSRSRAPIATEGE